MRLDSACFEHHPQTLGILLDVHRVAGYVRYRQKFPQLAHDPVFIFLAIFPHGFHSRIGRGCLLRQCRKREKCNQQSDRRISQDFSPRMHIGALQSYRNCANSVSIPRQAAGLSSRKSLCFRETYFRRLSGSAGLLVRNPLTTVSQSTIRRRSHTF